MHTGKLYKNLKNMYTKKAENNITTMKTDFNREDLVSAYINRITDNMSIKSLLEIVNDILEDNFANYSDEELIAEIEESYPDLIED